jgi:hypothetical protein
MACQVDQPSTTATTADITREVACEAMAAPQLPAPPNGNAPQWCTDNQNGQAPGLGDADNPCARLCRASTAGNLDWLSLAQMLTGLRQSAGISPIDGGGIGIIGCAVAATGQGAQLALLLNDPWCSDNPSMCAVEAVTRGLCGAVAALGCPSTHPLVVAANAACGLGSILANSYEQSGYEQLCRDYINNAIPAPIDDTSQCQCDRVEREGGLFGAGNCAPSAQWSQIGTTAANCVDHDSDWLPVASPECAGGGASNGWTYYRYTNCHMLACVRAVEE